MIDNLIVAPGTFEVVSFFSFSLVGAWRNGCVYQASRPKIKNSYIFTGLEMSFLLCVPGYNFTVVTFTPGPRFNKITENKIGKDLGGLLV